MATLALGLLGPPLITLNNAPLGGFESDKVRALLFYLAAEAGRPHRRLALDELLWPERPERSALLNLNQALANLRRIVGDREAVVPLILATRESLQLNPAAPCAIDLAEFRALLATCAAHTHRSAASCAPCAERLARAAALYRGPFLDQFAPRGSPAFDEWAGLTREQLGRQAADALEQLAAFHERAGALSSALAAAQRHVELEPWDEAAHRRLMRLLAADGQRGAALAHYARLTETLETDLGITPEAETEALYEQIRQQEPLAGAGATPAPGDRQPAPSPIAPLHELPAPPTPFIGRADELALLGERLNEPGCRLLSIVGLGGCGKTRLALEAAGRYGSAFADGAHFVGLAGVSSADLLIPALAQSLGLSVNPRQPAQSLAAALRGRELLLVLDNLEQLRDGIGLLGELLERTPGLSILATSRERLGLPGEWAIDLGGLDLPAGPEPAAMERSGAGALFIQAARRARGSFRPDEAERRAIVRICRGLGGHPLAIELAAAWTQILSCAEIEHELAQNLDLLGSAAPGLHERHRTLSSILDATWTMLSPTERAALERLASFRGGFSREAAEAVLAGPGVAPLPLLTALASRALLQRGAGGRYELHEFVRQYAERRLLASGEAERAWMLHRRHYLALVEAAEPHLQGAGQAEWMRRLGQEQDNLRAALERALAAGAAEEVGRMCVVLRWFWYLRGDAGEGRGWLERALAAPGPLPAQLRARLAHGAGILADEQGASDTASAHYATALGLFRELGDLHGVRITTNSIGVLSLAQGRYAQAQACYEEGLRLAEQLGSRVGVANSLNNLGHAALAQGRGEEALSYLERALALGRELQHDLLINTVLDNIGDAARAAGDLGRAVGAYSEALALQQASDYSRGAALSLNGLGAVARLRGDLAEAERLLLAALDHAWPDSNPRELLLILEEIAALRAASGTPAEAARLSGACAAARERLGAPAQAHERHAVEQADTAARAALGPDSFAAAYATGRAAPLEQIVTELLRPAA